MDTGVENGTVIHQSEDARGKSRKIGMCMYQQSIMDIPTCQQRVGGRCKDDCSE